MSERMDSKSSGGNGVAAGNTAAREAHEPRAGVRIRSRNGSLFIACALAGSLGFSLIAKSALSQTFPLKASPNGRYLVDRKNVPFLIVGDAPQALMVNVSEADADMYFANRASHGFNAVWINLLCADYTGGRPDARTFDGIPPFTKPKDLSTPNEAYFARCDRILRLAAKHGLVVFLDPAETGSFLSVMRQNGADKCREYGNYLGKRYKNLDNIIWMSGNDYQDWSDAANDAVVTAVARGIKEEDPRALQTAELSYLRSSSLDDARWASLLSLDASYTYYPTYAEVLKDYNRKNFLPVFLVEADYEFENGADPERLRRQEYWAMLSGAAGQIYGNGYVWPFKPDWKAHLDTPGAIQMSYLKSLFQSRAWYALQPDQSHKLVTEGYGRFEDEGKPHSGISANDYAAAALTPDGSLAVAYLPTIRTITVDMSRMSGPAKASWFDPTKGVYASAPGSPFSNRGSRSFAPPGENGEGKGDWVLILDAGSRKPDGASRRRLKGHKSPPP
jgi:hypothetical protein